ncbi:MAG: lipopolysaccharide biosynthesis protein [Betaproteobacteria bacterium]
MNVRGFFRDALTYAVPAVFTRAIGLVLLPFYARHLSPEEYGVVEVLAIVYVLLNLVLPLEVSQAVARFSADAPAAARKSAYVSTAVIFTGLVFAGFAALAWIAPAGALSALLGSELAGQALAPASLWMMANALFYVVSNQLRWDRQPRAYAVTSATFGFSAAGAAVVFIAGFGLGVHGYIWGQFAGSLAGLATGIASLRATTRVVPRFDIGELKSMLTFSAPLVLSSAAVYLALYVDRWLLFAWRGEAELGVYAAAYRIASIVTLAVSVVQLALTPMIYAHHQSAETPPALRRIFRYFVLAACWLVLGIAAFAMEIVTLIAGAPYQRASASIPWLCLGMVLANVYLFAPGLILAKRTSTIAVLSAISAAVNIAASVTLIPLFGATGAALGMMAASGASAALYLWLGERHYRVAHEWRRVAIVLLTLPALLVFPELALSWRFALLLATGALLSLILLDRNDMRGLDNRLANLRRP